MVGKSESAIRKQEIDWYGLSGGIAVRSPYKVDFHLIADRTNYFWRRQTENSLKKIQKNSLEKMII
jgi:hypothetical protein